MQPQQSRVGELATNQMARDRLRKSRVHSTSSKKFVKTNPYFGSLPPNILFFLRVRHWQVGAAAFEQYQREIEPGAGRWTRRRSPWRKAHTVLGSDQSSFEY